MAGTTGDGVNVGDWGLSVGISVKGVDVTQGVPQGVLVGEAVRVGRRVRVSVPVGDGDGETVSVGPMVAVAVTAFVGGGVGLASGALKRLQAVMARRSNGKRRNRGFIKWVNECSTNER